MFILLSPAKSLDFATPAPVKTTSALLFEKDALYLASLAARLSSPQLQTMMGISSTLAALNVERFAAIVNKSAIAKQAIFAFDGDVYTGLKAQELSVRSLNYLQKHLRILSGMYGILRPFDLMYAYRLEMGSTLKNSAGASLYAYWSDKLSHYLQDEVSASKSKAVINLASEEYAKAVKLKTLGVPVIHPVFQDYSKGQYKVISFFAKRARGAMARYCAEHQIKKPQQLKEFEVDDYRYCEEESSETKWVFRRRVA